MAKKNKDPAFLMYSADFLVGTALMTNEQVGMYIRILMHQHQSGRLTKDEIVLICGTYDSKVMTKFTQDDDGLYFNERLEEESLKRKKYTESRRNNRISTKTEKEEETYVDTYVESYDVAVSTHMENENINENKDITSSKERNIIPPTVDMIARYCLERNNGIDPQYFWDSYNAKGWVVGKSKMKDWQSSVRTWEKNNYNKPQKSGNNFMDL